MWENSKESFSSYLYNRSSSHLKTVKFIQEKHRVESVWVHWLKLGVTTKPVSRPVIGQLSPFLAPYWLKLIFYSTLVISDGVADWLSHCQTRFCDIFYQEWFTYLLTEIMYHNQRWSLFFWTFKMDKWKDWQMWGSVNDIEMWFLATLVFLNNFLIYLPF